MEIEIWSNSQLQKHLDKSEYGIYLNHTNQTRFNGFTYFGPNWNSERPAFDNGEVTFRIPDIDSFPEDKNIIALESQKIIGLFALMYGFYHYDFPNYYPRILEVRKDKKNQGVATSLIRRLKEPCFLHGKVLMIKDSSYTQDGRKYLKSTFDRELNGSLPFRFLDGSMTRLEDYCLTNR